MQKRMTHAIIQKTAIVTIVKVVIVSKIKKKNYEPLCSPQRHCTLSCKSLKVKKKQKKQEKHIWFNLII